MRELPEAARLHFGRSAEEAPDDGHEGGPGSIPPVLDTFAYVYYHGSFFSFLSPGLCTRCWAPNCRSCCKWWEAGGLFFFFFFFSFFFPLPFLPYLFMMKRVWHKKTGAWYL